MSDRCPVVPDLDELDGEELDRVIGAPLSCRACGGELELRCGEGHLHAPPASPSPNHRPAVKQPRARTCAAGHPLPPFKSRCLICRPMPIRVPSGRPRRTGPRAPQTFAPKPCACGRTFTPTGPNAKRCEVCRGVAA